MANENLMKNDELQMTTASARLTAEGVQASLAVGATAAQVVQSEHGTREQMAALSTQTTISKDGVNQETRFASVAVTTDAKGNTINSDVTVANRTTDQDGNTRTATITTAGAGQSFRIEGDKGKGGVVSQYTHEATAVIEDEHGNQHMRLYFLVARYNKNICAEKSFALKQAGELIPKVPNHIVTRVLVKTLLLIFFLFQLLYPLIAFLIERKFVIYNLICIVVGAVGLIQELTDIDLLFKNYKKCCCYCVDHCRNDSNDENTDDDDEDDNEDPGCYAKCQEIYKCCPYPIRKIMKITFEEILLYIAVVCNITAVINDQTWKLESAKDYLDSLLLLYSLIMEILVPRVHSLMWLISAINLTYKKYFEAHGRRQIELSCKCFDSCFNPLRFMPLFIIGIFVLQFLMLALVTVRIYADNYLGIDQEELEDGSYIVTTNTWLAMLGGILIPLWSILTYFIINQYWIWYPLHYIKNHTSDSPPKYSNIETMNYMDKWIVYAFDPLAWFAMIVLCSLLIGFAIVSSGSDYEINLYDGIPDALEGVHTASLFFMFIVFFMVHIQTMAFFLTLCLSPMLCCVLPLHFIFHRPSNRLRKFDN